MYTNTLKIITENLFFSYEKSHLYANIKKYYTDLFAFHFFNK